MTLQLETSCCKQLLISGSKPDKRHLGHELIIYMSGNITGCREVFLVLWMTEAQQRY